MSSEQNNDYSTFTEAGHKSVMELAGQANNLAVLSPAGYPEKLFRAEYPAPAAVRDIHWSRLADRPSF